jgi:4-hydroxybenzoyl-CoA reductase subunit beta
VMRLPRFTLVEPRSIDEAVRARADAGADASFVAGGTDLWPNMKRRQQTPRTVIALGRVQGIDGIRLAPDGGLTIGAGATLESVARHPLVRAKYPAVARAAELVSTPTLRHMGTIGGNLLLDTRCNYYDQTEEWRRAIHYCMKKDGAICWVAPSSPRCWAVQSYDGVPVAVALGAEVTLVSARGERRVRAADLYANDGMAYLTKQPDELLAWYHLPPVNGWRAVYLKLRRRGSFDFPVLGVAAWVSRAGDGTVKDARIVLGAVASYPQEVPEAAKAIVGTRLEPDAIAAAADAAHRPAKPMDNTDFTLAWRKEMVRVHVARALAELAAAR